MAGDQDEYYLTVAEVAELLRLNQQTVRNWIDQGSLPALRVGRRVRIKRSDLDRLLTEGYSGGTQGGAVESGPSAEDFWGGEPVGVAEVGEGGAVPDSTATGQSGASGADAFVGGAATRGGAARRADAATVLDDLSDDD